MPSNTVTEPAVPLEERNNSHCEFDWCDVDHFTVGWEDDENGDPYRNHYLEPTGEFRYYLPQLSVEERRTRTGVEISDPIVTFDGSQKEFTVDEAARAVHDILAVVPKWREIAAAHADRTEA